MSIFPTLRQNTLYTKVLAYLALNSSKLSSPCGSCASVIFLALVAKPHLTTGIVVRCCTRFVRVVRRAEGEEKSRARATRAMAAEDMVVVERRVEGRGRGCRVLRG